MLNASPQELLAHIRAMPESVRTALSKAEKLELLRLIDELEERILRENLNRARGNILPFAHSIYPGFKEGPQHRVMARVFDEVITGKKRRVIINIAPRHSKSEFTSFLLPAYFLGQYPDKKIIMATHTASLSEDFGRRVRNLIQSADYNKIFPDTEVSSDQKAAGKWSTTAGGQYYAVGVGGALAGRGADLLVVDDPHSEQDVVNNAKATFDSAWSWFQTGPLQRLMPGGAIMVVMTRWGTGDLTGKLLSQYINDDTDHVEPWEVIELPAILHENTEEERPLWPEFWSLGELRAKRASMDRRYWAAQYQQKPTDDEGALIKRESWKLWTKPEPPDCDYIIQSWDTAYLAKETADFNACTTWGVFTVDDEKGKPQNNIILLNAFKARMEFPELKKTALKHYQEWEPDTCIVEAKAAGLPLLQEMRMAGIPVQDFTPSRGNDKTVRVNSVADIFASGLVWCPDRSWARDVQDECAAFPNAEHDDYVDTVTSALIRFRRGGFIRLPDEDDEDSDKKKWQGANKFYRVTG